jgi:predicted ATPase/DNA-binding XRE family transcriptional regulator
MFGRRRRPRSSPKFTGRTGVKDELVEKQASAFGTLLRVHRRRVGLSQEELAERAGVSAKAIGALEQGRRRAPYEGTVDLLTEALGLDEPLRADFGKAASRARLRTSIRDREDTDGNRGDNLPAQVTSFVGRDRELEDLARLVASHRLLTVTGPGGFGKTRLALESASRNRANYNDGVWFVELASVSDGSSVLAKITSTLGLKAADRDPLEGLAMRLADRNLLLLLDNCEHVLAHVVPIISVVLRSCPRVVVMATSRERLAHTGEVTFRIPSLSVPVSGDDQTAVGVFSHAAVRLFVDRAQMADPRFLLTDARAFAVADICRKLEGIPLAIEIAAARVQQFGLLRLRRKLDDRLNPLTNPFIDSPSRQRTLQAMLDWSFELLGDAERAVFRRLSVFPRGCTVEAARAVASDDHIAAASIETLLESLVDKSLLGIVEKNDDVRFLFLDSTRDFATEKLAAAGETVETSRRLVAWARTFAETMHTQRFRERDQVYFAVAAAEFDNVSAAVFAALDGERDLLAAAAILGSLHIYWNDLGRGESLRIAADILTRLDPRVHPGFVASIHLGRANMLCGFPRLEAVRVACDILHGSDDALRLMHCFLHLAWANDFVGHSSDASEALDVAWQFAVEAGLDNAHVAVLILYLRAKAVEGRGDVRLARDTFAASAVLATASGDRVSEAWSRAAYADMLFCEGEVVAALALLDELVRGAVRYGALDVLLQIRVAACRIVLGDVDGAEEAARFAFRAADGFAPHMLEALERLAHVFSLRGDCVRAARLLGYVDARIAGDGFARGTLNQVSHAALVANLRSQISVDEFLSLYAGGKAMTVEEAMAEADHLSHESITIDVNVGSYATNGPRTAAAGKM